jgi:hypothetical protein
MCNYNNGKTLNITYPLVSSYFDNVLFRAEKAGVSRLGSGYGGVGT